MLLKSFLENTLEPVSHNGKIQKSVLIRNGVVANITQLARSVFSPGEVVEPHCHSDMFEVFMVRSGTAIFAVDGKRHELEKDACIIIEPGESHEVENVGSDKLVLDYFGLQTSNVTIPSKSR